MQSTGEDDIHKCNSDRKPTIITLCGPSDSNYLIVKSLMISILSNFRCDSMTIQITPPKRKLKKETSKKKPLIKNIEEG